MGMWIRGHRPLVLTGVVLIAGAVVLATTWGGTRTGAGEGVRAPATTGTVGVLVAAPPSATATVVPVAATPQSGIMASGVAAARAVMLAQRQPYVRLVGEPTVIRGRVMTIAQAREFLGIPPLEPVDGLWPLRNEPVWVVVVYGTMQSAQPGGLSYSQMILLLDPKMGEFMGGAAPPPQNELPTASMPVLTPAPGPLPALPTPVRPTAVPHTPKPAPSQVPLPPPGTPDPR